MSELLLEEHKLLNRVIQFWSDTNGFRDKKYLIERIRFNQITNDEIKDINGNFCLESELLDFNTAKKLITWISGKKNHHRCWYKFELLFHMKRDGLKSETFHKNCDRKGPTIVIIKLFDNDNLIDSYNLFDWECRNVLKKTMDSFLFQKYKCLNGYIYKKSNIIPSYENKAIACSSSNCLMFGITDLYIQSGSKYCNLRSSNYESLNISGDYLMKSYEVLRVITK
ncbi:25749_t:CDS:2, partial [Gigaspora margarita]